MRKAESAHLEEILHTLTSYVYAFIDNELTMSQVVEDRLKVLWAAVDQVSPVLVPLVPPHVWSDNKTRSDEPLQHSGGDMLSDWPACCVTYLSLGTCERAYSLALC